MTDEICLTHKMVARLGRVRVLPWRRQGDQFTGSNHDDTYPELEKQAGAFP